MKKIFCLRYFVAQVYVAAGLPKSQDLSGKKALSGCNKCLQENNWCLQTVKDNFFSMSSEKVAEQGRKSMARGSAADFDLRCNTTGTEYGSTAQCWRRQIAKERGHR